MSFVCSDASDKSGDDDDDEENNDSDNESDENEHKDGDISEEKPDLRYALYFYHL